MSNPITLRRQHVTQGFRVAPGWVGAALAILAAIAWPLAFQNPFLLTIGSLVTIYLIASTSLHLVIRMGHISFAHASMMGIGAYVSADTMMKLSLPFALSVSCAAAASALRSCSA